MSENDIVKRIESCADCPFLESLACKLDPEIEIDDETKEDDLPTLCPLLDGMPRSNDNVTVTAAKWLLIKK